MTRHTVARREAGPLLRIASILLLVSIALAAPAASVAPGVWLTDNVAWQPGGHESDFALKMAATDTFAVIQLTVAEGLDVADVEALSVDSFYIEGTCGGGSPRAQLRIDVDDDGASSVADRNVFVYAGPAPSYAGCAPGAWYEDDLLDGAPRWDASQIGGSFYGTHAQAAALAGEHDVLSVTFVWDSYWMTPHYDLRIDNVRVNGYVLDEPGVGEACSLVHGATGSACP